MSAAKAVATIVLVFISPVFLFLGYWICGAGAMALTPADAGLLRVVMAVRLRKLRRLQSKSHPSNGEGQTQRQSDLRSHDPLRERMLY
jgi:hypothetical protein